MSAPPRKSHHGRHAARADSGWRLLAERLEDDAAAAGISRRAAWTVFWVPIVGTVLLLALYLVTRPPYYWVLREDKPVEWLQFALLLFSGSVAAFAALRFAQRRRILLAVVLGLVAVVSIVIAGEEISWAQRVFNIATPAELEAVNKQAELNLHNVSSVASLFKIFSFLMAAVGIALALFCRWRSNGMRSGVLAVLAPPLVAIPGFAVMALHRIALLAVEPNPLVVYQEWAEVSLYVSLAATVVCILLRAQGARDLDGGAAAVAVATRTDLRVPIIFGVLTLVVTIVFAAMTAYHGIIPGNVSPQP